MKRLAWLVCPIAVLLAIGLVEFEGPGRAVHLMLSALALLCGMGAVFGIVYTLLAGALIRRFFARTPSQPSSFPPVTIVKPLHGNEWADRKSVV